MSTNPNDFLLGGGGKSAAFDTIGDSISGTITAEPEVRQQTDIQSGKPQTWDNGDPKYQLVVTLQTTLRTDDEDDGVRNLYIKGSKKPGTRSLHDAVATAVRNAGADGLAKGGVLTVRFVGEEPSQTRGFNPRKLYEASYVSPSPGAASGEYLGTAGQRSLEQAVDRVGQAARVIDNMGQAVQQAAQNVATSDEQAKNIETAKTLIGVGQTDDVIHQVTGLDHAVIAALRNVAA
ncbi:MAG TPA: hypothetical protein VFR23_25325 [Jiangellaceae bacterium]|nr:hypothetical protein [Jiangellaceae bacterium]